jgi:hypothetical protein
MDLEGFFFFLLEDFSLSLLAASVASEEVPPPLSAKERPSTAPSSEPPAFHFLYSSLSLGRNSLNSDGTPVCVERNYDGLGERWVGEMIDRGKWGRIARWDR